MNYKNVSNITFLVLGNLKGTLPMAGVLMVISTDGVLGTLALTTAMGTSSTELLLD